MSRVEIKAVWEGRMGNNRTKTWEAHVDGKLVVFHERKWMVKAVAEAIVAGHIPADGNPVWGYSKWAEKNAPEMYARICATGADGFQ